MTELLIPLLIFVVAAMYSTVGHAGASGYLAVMAMFGIAPAVMRPAALVLNILVAILATIRFGRAGCFSWRVFLPVAVLAVPCAFWGGKFTLPAPIYRQVIGAVLAFAAIRLFARAGITERGQCKPPSWALGLPVGAGLGFLSGLTGVGGGIFLSPLVLLMNWADPRTTAGVSAAFILVNSIAGLVAQWRGAMALPPVVLIWAMAAITGGAIGAALGAKRLAGQTIRRWLAVVLVVAAVKMIWGG